MPSGPRKLVLCLAVALATLAGTSSAAQAGVSWVVHGHGFGHGVGMSQYGAYGYAKHGKSYRFILAHYYQGTTLGTLPGPRVVRVLIDVSGGDVGGTVCPASGYAHGLSTTDIAQTDDGQD